MEIIKKILLIGGTGVLSSAVVAEALRNGIDVTIVTRGKRNIPCGVTSIICDKFDYVKLATLVTVHYDAVIDFLCYTETELEKSFRFYSQYTKQYFFISSCAVYANQEKGVIHVEDSPKIRPNWQYSLDKWAAEQKLIQNAKETKCCYTIIRPAVTYDNTRIPYGVSPQYGFHWTLCARILAGKPIITWNNGENRCNMMRVEDFAVGVVGLIGNEKAYNEAFNICGDETPSWREVLSIVEVYVGKKAITIDMPAKFYAQQIPNRAGELLEGRAKDGINSNAKLKSAVPEFSQTIFIMDGIHRTLGAYEAQNYQHGIDWQFDAETDKIIERWCKQEGKSISNMNLQFVDYLGTASFFDRITYSRIRYKESKLKLFLWKGFHKVYQLFNK